MLSSLALGRLRLTLLSLLSIPTLLFSPSFPFMWMIAFSFAIPFPCTSGLFPNFRRPSRSSTWVRPHFISAIASLMIVHVAKFGYLSAHIVWNYCGCGTCLTVPLLLLPCLLNLISFHHYPTLYLMLRTMT